MRKKVIEFPPGHAIGTLLDAAQESAAERAALALTDQVWMPRPTELFEKFDPATTDFTYVRWLGDRKGIEGRLGFGIG